MANAKELAPLMVVRDKKKKITAEIKSCEGIVVLQGPCQGTCS
jgi:hypothetical protein